MICPNCQNEQKITEHNFGALHTCTSCKAVYFINFDGQPEFGEANSEEYETADRANKAEVRAHQASQEAERNEPFATPLESPAFPDNGLEPLMSITENLEPQIQGESLLSQMLAGNNSADVENPFEFQNNLESLSPAPVAAPIKPAARPAVAKQQPAANAKGNSGGLFADIAQEISDFANTDSHLAGLNYDLVISGIDTVETKNLFKEAIEDSKFAWDSTEIMKSLKNGRVQILRMSPTKAFLLAKRIQFLDIEKSWKQNVLN